MTKVDSRQLNVETWRVMSVRRRKKRSLQLHLAQNMKSELVNDRVVVLAFEREVIGEPGHHPTGEVGDLEAVLLQICGGAK